MRPTLIEHITVCNRFNRRTNVSPWDQLMDIIIDAHGGDLMMIGRTSLGICHVSATFKNNSLRDTEPLRNGLATKIHAPVNKNELPFRFHITSEQLHNKCVYPLLAGLREGQTLLADKDYNAHC